MASSFSLRAFSVDQYYVADFVFLEQHKSLLTDFNGRIAQNCCLCSSYTKINETVLLSLPSSPFLVCSEIYMYVETHASPPGHSKLRATLLFFFLRWKAGAISFFGQKSKYIRKLNQPYQNSTKQQNNNDNKNSNEFQICMF